LDADRSGREAMLRAARMAREKDVELRVVVMPEGTDPAELVAAEGEAGVARRLDGSQSVLQFEVGRVLDDADLDSPEARDRALVAARALIEESPERSAQRDDLVRRVADRLDVDASYVAATARAPVLVATADASPRAMGATALRAERAHLAACLAAGDDGLEALKRLGPGHLPAPVLVRARDHLVEHFDDPLGGIPPDDPDLGRAVIDVAQQAEDLAGVGPEQLRIGFLTLEERRLDREMRRAEDQHKSELAAAQQRVKDERAAAMGQAS
jgi:DNA primase